MLKLSQARKDQVKEINNDCDFYKNYRFGCFYLCDGDDLIYINHEDDDYILSWLHRGGKIVAIKEDD